MTTSEQTLATALATIQERDQQIARLLKQLDRIETSRDRLQRVVESLKADAAHAARSIDAIIAEQVN